MKKKYLGFNVFIMAGVLGLPNITKAESRSERLFNRNLSVNTKTTPGHCYFGSSPSGAVRFNYTRIQDEFGKHYFEAVLSPDLRASVTRTTGHNNAYKLRISYKNNEIIMRDEYVDFQPLRNLYVEGEINGQPLSCEFNPADFDKIDRADSCEKNVTTSNITTVA